MKKSFVTVMAIGATALWLGSADASAGDARCNVPEMPASLQVPDGYSVFFSGQAIGTQNYMCLPSGTGVAWKFVAPQATLFRDVEVDGASRQLTTHFLSVNPDEGIARPTWQHSRDSSRVWGRLHASSSDPAFVEAGAIPWLLLDVAGIDAGGDGDGTLARTKFIQRLNTSGGTAPAAGCGQAGDIGALALVPYAADYFFYAPDSEP
jgi:hypothetical protein